MHSIFSGACKKPSAILHLEDSDDDLRGALKRSFAVLERGLLSHKPNPELDAKFYFLMPLSALELLPFECLHPLLNLYVLLVLLCLLSVSAHEDVNDRLLLALARSLDPSIRSRFHLSSFLDLATVLPWLAKLKYEEGGRYLALAQKFVAAYLVRARTPNVAWASYSECLKRLSAALNDGLADERSATAAITLMEALERPLTSKDLPEDKAKICQRDFRTLARGVLNSLDDCMNLDLKKQYLLMRGLASVFTVWKTALKNIKQKWIGGIHSVATIAVDYLPHPHAIALLTNAFRVRDEIQVGGNEKLIQRLWDVVASLQHPLGDLEDLVKCLVESTDPVTLTENLTKLIVSVENVDAYTLSLGFNNFQAKAEATPSPEDKQGFVFFFKCLVNANLSPESESVREKALERFVMLLQTASMAKDTEALRMSFMNLENTLLHANKVM